MQVNNELKEAKYIKINKKKKEQNHHSKMVQRVVSSLVVIFCFGFLIMGGANWVSATSHAYVLKVDDQKIATLVSEQEAQQAIELTLNNIKNSDAFTEYELDITYDNSMSVEQIPANGVVYSSVSETSEMLFNSLDLVANATALRINGEDALYVADENQAIEAVNAAKNYYADPNEDPSVLRVYTSEEISIAQATVSLQDVLSLEEATDLLLFGDDKNAEEPEGLITVNVERTKTETEILPFETVKKENASMAWGQEEVITEGVDGMQEVTYRVREENGVIVGSKAMSNEVLVAAVDEVVEVGVQYYYAVNRTDIGGNGALGWPADGLLSSTFGWRSRGWHSGIDIAAPIGTPIYASEAGVVIETSIESGYGLVVRIDHGDGLVTVYAHCNQFNVSVGDIVTRKTVIATIGMTGTTTGPHVHYEVRVNGQAVDPLGYLE